MKNIKKPFYILFAAIILLSAPSCGKNEKTSSDEKNISEVADENAEDKNEEKTSGENDENVNKDNATVNSKSETDEQKAQNVVISYVEAAKKLDFDAMGRYISDGSSLPILDSYREAYAKYSVSDSRIKELCRARLSTYKITPVSSRKNGNNVVVTVKISRVNMESLQNKWMETLCNKYPEYTNLTEEQMTPQVVDVLIQTMIDVLKSAESTVDEQKDFTVENRNDAWIINAKNADFFPAN